MSSVLSLVCARGWLSFINYSDACCCCCHCGACLFKGVISVPHPPRRLRVCDILWSRDPHNITILSPLNIREVILLRYIGDRCHPCFAYFRLIVTGCTSHLCLYPCTRALVWKRKPLLSEGQQLSPALWSRHWPFFCYNSLSFLSLKIRS